MNTEMSCAKHSTALCSCCTYTVYVYTYTVSHCLFSCFSVSLSDVRNIANPLNKVEAGLKVEGADVPLQAVHIRAQLIDLAAKVMKKCMYTKHITVVNLVTDY